MIQFQCHGCGRAFSVPESMAGTAAQCTSCGTVVTVPLPQPATLQPLPPQQLQPHLMPMGGGYGAAPQHDPFAAAQPTYAEDEPAADAGQRRLLVAIASGVGMVVVALLVLFFVMRSGGDRRVAQDDTAVEEDLPDVLRPQQRDASSFDLGQSTALPGTPGMTGDATRPPVAAPESTSPPSTSPPVPASTTPPTTPNIPGGAGAATSSDPFTTPTAPTTGASPSPSPFEPASPSESNPGETAVPASGAPSAGAGPVSTGATPRAPGTTGPQGDYTPQGSAEGANNAKKSLLDQMRAEMQEQSNETPSGDAAKQEAKGLAWTAEVDPPLQPIAPLGKLTVALADRAKIVHPHGPSNFALIYGGFFSSAAEGLQVLDLRSGKPIGKTVPALEKGVTGDLCFSPDGRYVAAQIGHSNAVIGVWSFITGELHQTLDGQFGYGFQFRFGGPQQMVTAARQPGGALISVWDLETGEREQEFATTFVEGYKGLVDHSLCVSNGGRYVSLIVGETLQCYELSSGAQVGELTLPEGYYQVQGIEYSPQGDRLALLLKKGSDWVLLCWNAASGEVVFERTISDDSFIFYDGLAIDWALSNDLLVIEGHVLVDTEMGGPFWTLPKTDQRGRRLLTAGKLLVANDAGRSEQLMTVDLPTTDMGKARAAVREGGLVVDAALPKLTPVRSDAAPRAQMPTERPAWRMEPDPLPIGKPLLERPAVVAESNERIRDIRLGAGTFGRALVLKEVSARIGARGGNRVLLERYDLARSKEISQADLPGLYRLLDGSPNCDQALLGIAGPKDRGPSRLDVITAASGRPIAAWRPYVDEPDAAHRYCVGAMMLDDQHVLSVNGAGKLICWKVPECSPLYVHENFGQAMAVSAGRRYISGLHEGHFRVFEARTGECVGELETAAGGAQPVRAAFAPNGRELTAVLKGASLILVRWDLATGILKDAFPLPPDAVRSSLSFFSDSAQQTLAWRGDRHLLLDNTYLIDLENRAVCWKYHMARGTHLADTPDGMHWCALHDDGLEAKTYLVTTPMPSLGTKSKTDFVNLDDQLVFRPGMSVRVVVRINQQGVSNQEAGDALVDRLERAGVIVDQSSDLLLEMATSSGTTGDTLVAIGQGSATQFQQEQRTCTLSLKRGNETLWQVSWSLATRSFGMVFGGNAEGQLRNELDSGFNSLLRGGTMAERVPVYIFREMPKMLAGESSISINGEGPPPPPPKPQDEMNPGGMPGGMPGGLPGGRPGGLPGFPGGLPGRPGGLPGIPGGRPGLPF